MHKTKEQKKSSTAYFQVLWGQVIKILHAKKDYAAKVPKEFMLYSRSLSSSILAQKGHYLEDE